MRTSYKSADDLKRAALRSGATVKMAGGGVFNSGGTVAALQRKAQAPAPPPAPAAPSVAPPNNAEVASLKEANDVLAKAIVQLMKKAEEQSAVIQQLQQSIQQSATVEAVKQDAPTVEKKTEWAFDIIRDADGRIKSVKAKPVAGKPDSVNDKAIEISRRMRA